MTNLEIDRRLALAIGYTTEDVKFSNGSVWVLRSLPLDYPRSWWPFYHKAADTIYPIAEHFKMMPVWLQLPNTWRNFLFLKNRKIRFVDHTDPRTCIALAVIEAAERGLLK